LEFTTIKGFRDILPEEIKPWQDLESAARSIFENFGFREIRTPILERTELFSRGIGQDTDIVSKEMYTLMDSKGRGMTMRPEATASVVRAYIQKHLYRKDSVQKLYSLGPMFRHERPQKGRFRQFYQLNAELIGDEGPRSDADLIIMAMYLVSTIGLDDLTLNLNSLGCTKCRPQFKTKLKDYLVKKTDSLCSDCQRRSVTNPLRVFDCKVDSCKQVVMDAPSILEDLCQSCQDHFGELQVYLQAADISYALNHKLVRGLDYYNRTAFEIQTEHLGAQNAVGGGGRYDGLVKLLGGPDQPAIGFALGADRIIALLEEKGKQESPGTDLFIAALGDMAWKLCFRWAIELRKKSLSVEMDYGVKSLKAQMKRADRLQSKKVLIVGEDELEKGTVILRDMETREQQEIPANNMIENLMKQL
jgi:histidyl-tRNA synthetase